MKTMRERSVRTAAGLLTIAIAAQAVPSVAQTGAGETPARMVETLKVRYWPSIPDQPYYPERDDPSFEYLWQRPSFGIAFSGGGTRSASAVWGQLRGLDRLGWLDHAQYISSVSGGAWASVPYTFLANACQAEAKQGGKQTFDCLDSDDQAVLDAWFLGKYEGPRDLDDQKLGAENGSFVYALSRTQLIRLYLSRLPFRGDETYSRAVGKRFLHAVGQYDCQPVVGGCDDPPKHRYFVAHDAQRSRIAAASSLGESDFAAMAARRPFLIAGATIIAKKRFAGKPFDLFPFEMTPLYVGYPSRLASRFGDTFGGGFIEAPGWDGESYDFSKGETSGERFQTVEVVKRQPLRTGVKLRYRMTLADVLGGSGAAPALVARRLGLSSLGFPEWDAPPLGVSVSPAAEYAFGDGAHLENLGVIPLLGRQVENILVFVNTARPFRFATARDGSAAADRSSSCREAKKLTDVHKLFADCWLTGTRPDGNEKVQALLELADPPSGPPVWPDPAVEEIEIAFKKLGESKKPLVHCNRYRALDNDRFGIREYTPKICWVVLDRVKGWVDDVPKSTRLGRQLSRKRVPFWATYKHFPHYGSLFHRWFKLRVIDLSEQQVNALAHLTAWTVVESEATIGPYLGLGAPAEGGSLPVQTAAGSSRPGGS